MIEGRLNLTQFLLGFVLASEIRDQMEGAHVLAELRHLPLEGVALLSRHVLRLLAQGAEPGLEDHVLRMDGNQILGSDMLLELGHDLKDLPQSLGRERKSGGPNGANAGGGPVCHGRLEGRSPRTGPRTGERQRQGQQTQTGAPRKPEVFTRHAHGILIGKALRCRNARSAEGIDEPARDRAHSPFSTVGA